MPVKAIFDLSALEEAVAGKLKSGKYKGEISSIVDEMISGDMNGRFGTDGDDIKDEMRNAADDLVNYINWYAVNALSPSSYFSKRGKYQHDAESVIRDIENISASEPKKVGDMKYEIELSFTTSLHRDSLDPSRYGGIDNIIKLIVQGSRPGKQMFVHGDWHGHPTSGVWRDPLPFIQEAVNDYNEHFGNIHKAIAYIDPDYVLSGTSFKYSL